MYLRDTNVVRHSGVAHPTLRMHLQEIPGVRNCVPSVAVAEILRGRSEFALKALPSKAPLAHVLLLQTYQVLNRFNVLVFDDKCADVLKELQKKNGLMSDTQILCWPQCQSK